MRRMLPIVAALVAAACLVPSIASGQTLDEIIAMNLKAKGGLEKIRATSTVRMTGHVTATDAPSAAPKNATTTMLAKRPNMMRREQTIDGETFVSAFDGATLWVQRGNQPPEEAQGSQAAYARQDAEFDSVFVDYKAKGHSIDAGWQGEARRRRCVALAGDEEGRAAAGLLPGCRDRAREDDRRHASHRAAGRRNSKQSSVIIATSMAG